MTRLYPKSIILRLCIALIALCALIYGCRKDISKTGEPSPVTPASPKIAAAKSWYEAKFPKRGKSTGQATNAVGDEFDLSQFFNPDWNKANNYNRFNDDVIEMPLDSASKIGLKVGSTEPTTSNSRSSVLILKRGEGYKAYIMTIVGDAGYINGDALKLAKNTYAKRDINFSGMVYYTTPQGKFVNGYTYKNGDIQGQLTDKAMPAGNQVTQSINPNLVLTYEVCTAWYQLVPDSEGDGYHWEYLDETNCHRITIVIPDSPPGTPPTSGSPPGDNPPPPSEDPCAGIGVSSVKDGKIINTVKVRLLYPGDGGFPPPAPDDPCTIPPVPDDDPCDKMKKQKQNLPLNFNTKNSQILAKPGTHEFGSDLKLNSLTLNSYKSTPITEGLNGYWTPNFTWNSTQGYTIGSSHRHQGAGPSPDDVFGLIEDRTTLSQIGASASDKQFFENNSYAVIVLNSATFIIKVSDWGTVQEMFTDYNLDRSGYGAAFQAMASEYKTLNNVDELTATTKILKDLFGDAIDLYKAPAGSTNFAIVGLDQDGKLIVVPCP